MQPRRSRSEGLREGAVTLLAVLVTCVAAGAALSFLTGEEWESTAVVTGGPAAVDEARTREVARRALDAAGARREPAAALLDHSEVERGPGGSLSFTVRTEEPAAARRLATSYARAYVDWLPPGATATARRGGPAHRDGDLVRMLLIGAAVGLVAGLLLALAREGLDARRTSSRAVAARLGTRELGRVPGAPADAEQAYGVAALEDPGGAAAAAYGEAAASLAAAADEASARVLLLAGAVAEDEGERVAANLAASLAAAGRRVAVVELEHGRQSLRRLFALEHGPGLAEVQRGEASLEQALNAVPGAAGLSVLTAGSQASPEPPQAPDAVLAKLAAAHALVVACGPPLLGSGAATLPKLDAVVLAVHLHRVRHSRRARLDRLLREIGVPLIGFVLVGASGVTVRPAEPVSADRA
jgi:hypothetical protein